MGIFYENKTEYVSLTEGQIAINKLRANPNSVPLCLENSQYYMAASDLERFMECANIDDVDEAVEYIAESNNIPSDEITVVVDSGSEEFLTSLSESAVLIEAVEDNAMTVRQANKFYKKLLKACKSKAESKKEIQERINALKECVRQMEAQKKRTKDGFKQGKQTDWGIGTYVLKDFIPFNSLWRLFKRNDKYAMLGNFANLVIPGGSILVRASSYTSMLQDNIDATNEAIKFLEEKLKEMK